MTFDDGSHVGHAAVTNLHAVSVAYGAKFVSRWEIFFLFSFLSLGVSALLGYASGCVEKFKTTRFFIHVVAFLLSRFSRDFDCFAEQLSKLL